MSWVADVAAWYGVLLAVGWGCAPWARLLCARLPDRGASVARPLGLLAVVWPLWWLASLDLVPYSTAGLWVTLALLAVGGWAVVVRRGLVDRTWLRALAVAEAVALAAFLGYVWLRGYTPQISGTEKPMDAAFLTASARTEVMPPLDPWLSGEGINYYYLGYLLHGSLSRMADVYPWVGYNLALATTFSMAFVAVAGLAYNAVRPWLRAERRALAAGALAPVLLLLVGNLLAPTRLLSDWTRTVDAGFWDDGNVGWRSSRIVCDGPRVADACEDRSVERTVDGSVETVVVEAVQTINEFPAFSFIFADLHPHVMALPFTVVSLTLALNLLLALRAGGGAEQRPFRYAVLAGTGAVIGALYALNSWDYPTFLVLAAVAVVAATRHQAMRTRLLDLGVLAGASLVAWLPFWVGFTPPAGGDEAALVPAVRDLPVVSRVLTLISANNWDTTSAGEFFTVFGLPYAFALVFLGAALVRSRPADGAGALSPRLLVGGLVVTGAIAVLLPAPLLLLCGAPLFACVELLRRDARPSPRTVAVALYGLGFALVLLTEFFYLQDHFHNRQNTLFKVYYQAWTLFAVATAVAVVALWRGAAGRTALRTALGGGLALALAAGLVYPLLTAPDWIDFGRGTFGTGDEWQGLDGLAYVGTRSADEEAAIRWLYANSEPGEVVLEIAGCSYGGNYAMPSNRASTFAGVQDIVAWPGSHEKLWRSGQADLRAEAIDGRVADVQEALRDPKGEAIDRYGVDYLYVGTYERDGLDCTHARAVEEVASASYPGDGWARVFDSPDVQIYERDAAAMGRAGEGTAGTDRSPAAP